MSDTLQSSGDPTKDQIINCLHQLAVRSVELGYLDLASTLYITVGSSIEGTEKELAAMATIFALGHINDGDGPAV